MEELGSVDTLVDVVGTSIALHHLGVEAVYAAPLVLGAPSPPRRAGGYSNPAPATLELIAAANAPVAADNPVHKGAGELTTPGPARRAHHPGGVWPPGLQRPCRGGGTGYQGP